MRRRLGRDRFAVAGAAIILAVGLLAICAPWVTPHDPLQVRTEIRLAPPGTPGYLLGTDAAGRDILSRLLWGARVSLLMGFVPVVAATLCGVCIGLLTGFYGGWLDHVVMRVVDVLFAFPPILLAIGIAAALGPGISNAMLAMAVVLMPHFVRLVRGTVLSVRAADYVVAARACGASNRRLLSRHILVNSITPVIVYSSLETGRMIVLAASLGFLGLGAQPPTPEWGAMLADGREVLSIAPHVATIPGLVIFLVTLSLNLLGDGLRDALDPRLTT
ncbi:MAG TPA: ABC transporter permease [Chloroflexota bacterium]